MAGPLGQRHFVGNAMGGQGLFNLGEPLGGPAAARPRIHYQLEPHDEEYCCGNSLQLKEHPSRASATMPYAAQPLMRKLGPATVSYHARYSNHKLNCKSSLARSSIVRV